MLSNKNNKQPLIIWEKWQDPILSHLGDINNNKLSDENIDEDIDEDIIGYEETEKISYKYPIIITPMGMLPYSEKTSCETVFNFWTGHTNFSISKDISDILERCDGVETLDVFTRYRFRIAIGRAFKDSSIMTTINKKIYEYINE
jgi:hypothetical protein